MVTSLLDRPETVRPEVDRTEAGSFGEELQTLMSGVRLRTTWFGNQKQVSKDQKIQAAQTFDAESKSISMSKKLLDTNGDAWKALVRIRGEMIDTWQTESLPYPEPGIRLMKRTAIDSFAERMTRKRRDLQDATWILERQYPALREQAVIQLGDLYNPRDYPDTISGYFDVTWDYPNLEPPEYLRMASPSQYRQESERIRNRFNEAVMLAEQAFFAELHELVEHLLERLSGSEDGKPKIFRNTAITNLHDFFERFRNLNVGSSLELDRLVASAQQVVGNIDIQQLRTHEHLRTSVAQNLAVVRSRLDGLMVDRPRRNLIRSGTASNQP